MLDGRLGAVEHGLDVVAVGIADERTEVAGVVLRPQARRVQRLETECHRCFMERLTSSVLVAWKAKWIGAPTCRSAPSSIQKSGLPLRP